jgi:hypothetical protein
MTALNLTQETERATLVRPAATYSIGSFVSLQSNVVLQRENAFTGSKRRCSPAYPSPYSHQSFRVATALRLDFYVRTVPSRSLALMVRVRESMQSGEII